MRWSAYAAHAAYDAPTAEGGGLPGIVYMDTAATMLPPLPSLDDVATGVSQAGQLIGDGRSVNILAVTNDEPTVALFALGILRLGTLDLTGAAFDGRAPDPASVSLEFSDALDLATVSLPFTWLDVDHVIHLFVAFRPVPPRTRRASCSYWCACVSRADWCLQSDAMPDARLCDCAVAVLWLWLWL